MKTLYKADGVWTLDELDAPGADDGARGLVNPAPPKEG